VNLAQIRSAVPEIFHTQTKNTDSAQNRTIRSSLRAVMKLEEFGKFMDERNNSGVSATSPAYLGDLGGRLQREDADDLLKPADLDEHEGVAEGAGGRRQAAEQQVPVTVVAEVR